MEITSKQREILAKCLMDSTSGMGGAENALKGFTNLGTIAEVDVLDNKCLPINHYAIVEDFHKRALRVSSGVDTYLIEFDYSSVRLIGEMRAKRSEASIPCGLTTEKIISLIGLDKLYVSHYNYADLFLDQFWQEAVGKTLEQAYCSGISVAHGDKGYGYRREWEEVGVPFNHGMCLFYLTYVSSVYGERCKSESCEWVIENYPKYKPMLDGIEQRFKEALDTVKDW